MKQLYMNFFVSLFLFCAVGINADAYDCKVDGIYYNLNYTNNTASVTYRIITDSNKDAYSGAVTIPSTVKLSTEFSVTSIDHDAFSNCTDLTSVTIPNSVTSIGNGAFKGCTGLTRVNITDLSAWCGIELGAYNSNPLSYAHHLYLNGEEIKDLVIPNSVESIGYAAFEGCTGLTSVTIGNSVTSIGNLAFLVCTGLTSVTIGDSVESIGNSAFSDCTGLTSVTIGNSVESIGILAFSNCTDLTSVTIPNSVTSIGNGAFKGCTGLTRVNITDLSAWCGIELGAYNSNPLSYAHHLYLNGEEIKDLVIPNSVESIGYAAFYGCTGLTSVTRGNSVTSIGNSAFSGCSGLTSVTIPNSVTSIGKSAFSDCTGLTSVAIGDGVTSIGANAFYKCTNLTQLTIGISVTSIESNAFYGCTGLTSISFYCKEIKNWFEKNTSIKEVVIGNTVNTIASRALYNCTGLTSVTIGDSVESIGYAAFEGCASLNSVAIPNSVTSIDTNAFRNCTGLTSVTIGNSVTSIGNGAFYGCTGLTSVTIGDSLKTIGSFVFPNTKIYVNKGTISLVTLWNADYTPFEIGTDKELPCTYLSLLNSSQTTLSFKLNNMYQEYSYWIFGQERTDSEFVLRDLYPDYRYDGQIHVRLLSSNDDILLNTSGYFYTDPISPSVNNITTASSITIEGSYIHGDAEVANEYLTIENVRQNGNTVTLTGLNPRSEFNITYSVVIHYGNNGTRTYTSSKTTISTEALSLITQQPKVISAGNVIVAANSNLDDAEENVGFEWRRTDWTDDFASNSGTAYLYEGTMEGYIRNLYTEKLWKYRPFYTSTSGRTYYGEWVGIDPTNTSYFEPTVHTYATIEVQGNTAAVRGYAMRGTDNITRQGFMYWPQGASYVGRRDAPSVPSNAMTIEATGTVMEAKLTGLSYNTTYSYVAFATTSEGETFYGDERQFTTDIDMSGIEEVEMSSDAATPETWYDLHGRRLSEPRHGINILRMSDGTSRKIFVP